MSLKDFYNKYIVPLTIAFVIYAVSTIYNLETELKLINYKLDTTNYVLQDLYEQIANVKNNHYKDVIDLLKKEKESTGGD